MAKVRPIALSLQVRGNCQNGPGDFTTLVRVHLTA